MSIKNLNLPVSKGKRSNDPIEIFKGLTLRGTVENIWGPQEAALKEWHDKYRKGNDTVIEMNTGGGKTLVGLLIAQSIVNETDGQVLYVCPNNQLVEQTLEKAMECGFSVSSRYGGEWEAQREFEAGESFCVTNYQTVFNGFSIFKNKELDALILDDAHVAENIIRSQFTINISCEDDLFNEVLNIFRPHFARSPFAPPFEDVSNNDWDALVYVPLYIVAKYAQQLRKLLVDKGIEGDDNNKYPWEYLKNNLNTCCVILGGRRIQITPSIMPLHALPYFDNDVRRLYLTATMPTKTTFIKTFGVCDANIIEPKGKSGDAQRLFVFLSGDEDEQKENALELVGEKKSCVITPTKKRAREWSPPADIFETERGHSQIEEFRKSQEPKMLALPARYDGIDLPGNACKILILDGLPRGENLFDKFIEKSIQIESLRSSNTATRVVQAIGRIFRSNTDHGIVITKSSDLESWLLSSKNRKLLPELLQKQIQFSLTLNRKVEEVETTYPDLISAILEGDKEWDALYENSINQYKAGISKEASSEYCDLLIEEREAYLELWDGQYNKSAQLFMSLAEKAIEYDERLGAWYLQWAGLASQLNGKNDDALINFNKAANIRIELGRPDIDRDKVLKSKQKIEPSFQAITIVNFVRTKKARIHSMITEIDANLTYSDETNKAEEAVKKLGDLIGLKAERPDKTEGTGPDVIWIGEGEPYGISFELKTNKKVDGEYSKSDIRDCHDHHGWLLNKYPEKSFIESILGYKLPVSEKANPEKGLRVITIESLWDLSGRIQEMYKQVQLSGETDLESEFQRWLDYFGLNWPSCVEALPYRLAIDLKFEDN